MGCFSRDCCRSHIWLAEGCLPDINVLERKGGQGTAAESRLHRAPGGESDSVMWRFIHTNADRLVVILFGEAQGRHDNFFILSL
jgi:hypothetical protein